MIYKQDFIQEIFSNVANKYDLMNDLMSFGLHRLWKKRFCKLVDNPNSKILDVASGTGDIAFILHKKATDPDITLCDLNEEMLNIAKGRAIDKNLLSGLNYVIANAISLPFENDTFDYYTIAFGIRNIPDKHLALKEAYRVLKPRSKFLCMEFSAPRCFKKAYDTYSFKAIPMIGQLIAKNRQAYEYLVESIREFPAQNIFIDMMYSAGFKISSFQNLPLVSIYIGYKQ